MQQAACRSASAAARRSRRSRRTTTRRTSRRERPRPPAHGRRNLAVAACGRWSRSAPAIPHWCRWRPGVRSRRPGRSPCRATSRWPAGWAGRASPSTAAAPVAAASGAAAARGCCARAAGTTTVPAGDALRELVVADAMVELWRADRPAAPRLPVGPRADRAHDRAAHAGGGVRGGRGRRPRRPREAARRAGRPAVPDVLPRPAAVDERDAGDLADVARGHHRQADPPPPARLRRDRRRETAGDGAPNVGADQERAGGPGGHLPRRPAGAAGAAVRPQGAAAGVGGGVRLARLGRRVGRSRGRAAGSCARRWTPRRSGAAEHEPDAHVVHELGDLLFAAVNVARLAGVDPELALRAAGRPVPRRGSRGPSGWRPQAGWSSQLCRSRSRMPGTAAPRRSRGD